jgi:hypothetical protein
MLAGWRIEERGACGVGYAQATVLSEQVYKQRRCASLVGCDAKVLGYVATKDLTPLQ